MLTAVLAVVFAASNARAADEPLVVATLSTLNQKDKPKVQFWYGEPIRFQVEFTTRSKEGVSFRINGCDTPLYPVGDGLILKHKEGDTYRVELTPFYHLAPVFQPFTISTDEPLKQ